MSIIGGRNKSGSLEKFKAFLVTVEASFSQNEDPDLSSGSDGPLRVGGFMLYSDEHTQYHHECINTVKESDMTEKSEIQIMWGAPQKGSGCVTFRYLLFNDSTNLEKMGFECNFNLTNDTKCKGVFDFLHLPVARSKSIPPYK